MLGGMRDSGGRDGLGEELADFRGRVQELQAARSLPPDQRLQALEAALFELRYAADELWPRFQALARGTGSGGERREEQLLRALHQRLPLPVAVLDREGTIRRLNQSAAQLLGVGAGYATGRPLTGFVAPGDRAALRSQLAATARGDGDRSQVLGLLPGGVPVRMTMVALRPPGETRNSVLAVFQTPGNVPGPSPTPATADPAAELAEATRLTLLLDVLDDTAAALLTLRSAEPERVLGAVARELHGRVADWVVADAVTAEGKLRRCVVTAPAGPEAAKLAGDLLTQDPATCPLVAQAARDGHTCVQVRPQDVAGFGRDAEGSAVIARAGVVSLVCLPVPAPPGDPRGPAAAILTLFRTATGRAAGTASTAGTGATASAGAGGTAFGERPFSLSETGVLERVARHTALALDS